MQAQHSVLEGRRRLRCNKNNAILVTKQSTCSELAREGVQQSHMHKQQSSRGLVCTQRANTCCPAERRQLEREMTLGNTVLCASNFFQITVEQIST